MTPAAVLAFRDPLDRLAATANAAHVEGCGGFIRQAIIAGQALIEAKGLVGHGGWSRWVAETCVFSERTAQVYMQAARNPQRAADSLRDALRQALGDKAKKSDDLQIECEATDADLRIGACSELFASGIRPHAVITEPSRSRDLLSAFSELARACVNVPLVAVMVDTEFLPEVLARLCERLRYRGAETRGAKLITVFSPDDAAFNRAKARPCPPREIGGWQEYFIQRLTAPGELVCDPFMHAETAIAALEFGRRFVGCSLDADIVADTRRQIGVGR